MSVRSYTHTRTRTDIHAHISILYTNFIFIYVFTTPGLSLSLSLWWKRFSKFSYENYVCVPLFCGFACASGVSHIMCVSLFLSPYTLSHTCAPIYIRVWNALNASVIFSWFKVDRNWKCDSRCRAYTHSNTHAVMCTYILHINMCEY